MGKRIIVRRRGKGGVYSSPSHRHRSDAKYPQVTSADGVVEDIRHDPGRTTPLALVRFSRPGAPLERRYFLAHEGMLVGQRVAIGPAARPVSGNIIPLGSIPDGTRIFNIEARPGDGGKFVRAGGGMATLVSRGAECTVQLPSGQFKMFHPGCRATLGILSGGGRNEKPLAKAGKSYHATRPNAKIFPKVRGVAMNPIDHPHGGGGHQHVGRPSTVSRDAWPGQKVGRLSPKRRK